MVVKLGWKLWCLCGQIVAPCLMLGAAHCDAVPVMSELSWCCQETSHRSLIAVVGGGRKDVIITLSRVEELGSSAGCCVSPMKPLSPTLP